APAPIVPESPTAAKSKGSTGKQSTSAAAKPNATATAIPPAASAAASEARPSGYVAPAPARPYVPGPGKSAYLAALAWVFLSIAGIMFAARTDQLSVNSAVAWFVVFVTGLGVLVMMVGLAGRR